MKYKFLKTTLAAALATTTLLNLALADVAPEKADPKAYDLLKKAYEARQTLPEDFPGLDAQLTYQEGNKTLTGTIRYRNDEKSTVKISGLSEEDEKWLTRQAISFISHRTSGEFNASEGQYPLQFGKSEDTSLGTLVEYNDARKLTSRIRDGIAMELTRTAGDKRFFISTLENTECDPGKFIPTRYVVSYFDPQTRVLQTVNIFENSYTKIDRYWLPATRKVVTIDHVLGDGLRVRSFQFTDIKLAQTK